MATEKNGNMSELAQKLLETFNSLHRTIQHSFYKSLDSNLKPTQIMVMMKLLKASFRGEESLRISDIAGFLGITNSAVTQIITSLEKSGYVIRETGKMDRRVVKVVLTDNGKAVMKPAKDKLEKSIIGLEEVLGEEDSRTLYRLLRKTEEYFK